MKPRIFWINLNTAGFIHDAFDGSIFTFHGKHNLTPAVEKVAFEEIKQSYEIAKRENEQLRAKLKQHMEALEILCNEITGKGQP